MGEDNNTGWAVVVADAGREEIAERNIKALGYVVDFLWYRKLLRDKRIVVNGRRQRDHGPSSIVRRPLFPSYGFVLVEYGIDAANIDAAIGVSRLIRHPPADRVIGKPKRVRASIVERLRAACSAQEFDDPALRPKPEIRDDLKAGVRVREPQTGIVAVVLSLDEVGRVRYFTELFGGAPGWFSREEAQRLELMEA